MFVNIKKMILLYLGIVLLSNLSTTLAKMTEGNRRDRAQI